MKARPTVHRGILMRSRLESRFGRYLDDMEIPWAYEPRAFSGKAGEYLPDFELLGFDTPIYVEVKPRHDPEEIEGPMARMEIIWESDPAAALMMVFGDTGYTLRTEGRRWEVIEPDGLPGWDDVRASFGS